MFQFEYERQAQKNIIHPFRKVQSQKGDRNVKQASQFLIKVSFMRAPYAAYVGAERVCLSTFTTQKWFELTCTSIIHASCKIFSKYLNPASLKTPCKSLIQNQSSALSGYPSLFLTILLLIIWSGRSTLDRRSIQQTAHYSTQNDFPVPPFIRNIILSTKNPFTRSNSRKMWSIKSIFPKPRKIPTLSSIDRSQDSQMVMTTDLLLWRQKKRISAVSITPRLERAVYSCLDMITRIPLKTSVNIRNAVTVKLTIQHCVTVVAVKVKMKRKKIFVERDFA